MTKRLLIVLLLVVLPGIGLTHWYYPRLIANPTSTTSAPILGAPTTSTSWACVRADGTVNGAVQATQALVTSACGQLVAGDGITRYLEERVTTTRQQTTTTSTRRYEVVGSTEPRITDAQAANIILLSGAGGGAAPGGGSDYPAATLWVNCTSGGDDSRSKATVAASGGALPWATLGRAMWGSTSRGSPNGSEAADAGDVVEVTGTCNATTSCTSNDCGSSGRFDAWYAPWNSGEEGDPIRIQGSGSGFTITNTSGRFGPLIGATANIGAGGCRNYVEWANVIIDEANAAPSADSAMAVFYCPGTDGPSESSSWVLGGLVEDSTFIGVGAFEVTGNNYAAIRFEYVDGITVRNNNISGYGGGEEGADHNHTGITMYKWRNATIEYNTIADSGSGIYVKQIDVQNPPTMGTLAIRFNKFDSNYKAINFHRAPHTSSAPALFTQNLVINNIYGWYSLAFNDFTTPKYAQLINNTFVNNELGAIVYNKAGGTLAANAIEAKNNIVTGGDYAVTLQDVSGSVNTTNFDFDRNAYFGYATAFGDINASNTSFATWQGTPAEDPNGLNGTDPQYVNAGAGNYIPQNSTVLALGRVVHSIGGTNGDTIPAGAYITGTETIGYTAP